MKILIDLKHKKRSKSWLVSLFIGAVALFGLSVYLFLQDKEEPSPNFVMHTSGESHIPIQEWTTPKGMRVLLVSSPALPMVDMRLIFKAGSAYDGRLSGLAALTSKVLIQGSTQYDANTIATRIDHSGAQLSTAVNRDMMAITFRSLSKPAVFEEAFTTLLSVLSAPTFPQDVFMREQRHLIASLQEQQQLPNQVANLTFFPALYGNHPYAQPTNGTVATVAKIKRRHLLAFAARYYTIQNAVLAIVGDIDLTTAQALISRLESTLPADRPPAKALPQPKPPKQKVIHVPFNSTQTHIIYGGLGVSWKDPDFFPLYVGNFILGNPGLVSILFDQVREERGLAYNVSSQITPLLQTGPFIIYAQTRNEASHDATAVIQKLLQEFTANGPTPAQLRAAQSNITGNFALRLDSNAAVAEQLGLMGFYNLPSDYLASFRARVLDVSAEQVRAAFQKHVNLAQAILVTVGTPSVVSEPAHSTAQKTYDN